MMGGLLWYTYCNHPVRGIGDHGNHFTAKEDIIGAHPFSFQGMNQCRKSQSNQANKPVLLKNKRE